MKKSESYPVFCCKICFVAIYPVFCVFFVAIFCGEKLITFQFESDFLVMLLAEISREKLKQIVSVKDDLS